ncbi:RIO1 family regulatory kinase/ATPase [Candidatus Binatus sp.]|jgi:RIO kinase 1|uniref:RIO1 family regulatory kinase/ATPase domain-containing protein n=1 Tax=Candidatus Binatus sp. TaxID=2811406 RepID=UPI003BE85587
MSKYAVEMEDALDAFLGDGSITEVLYLVRSGKEATVYCCRGAETAGPALVAAKVYRSLERRAFRDDSMYHVGRGAALDSRSRRAFTNKSQFGRGVQYATWIGAEYETLALLKRAGADVPEPIARREHALLMEYFGDESGAAPMLIRADLTEETATACLRTILSNVGLWLRHDRVHADLSPYNLLYWEGRVVAIDFPQAVDARLNPNARELLFRDVEKICGHFEKYGIPANGNRIAGEMWRRYRVGAL